MKSLTLYPNWAHDVWTGEKQIEYRSWKTSYRGPILICAGAKKQKGLISGHALCVVKIKQVIQYPDGTYGWMLTPFETGESYHIEPFPVKGKVRFFETDDSLIKPVAWEHNGKVDNKLKETWCDETIAPLITK